MKTLFVITAIVFLSFTNNQPVPVKIKAEYLPASCSDSIVEPVQTGQYLSVTRMIGSNITEYGATGISSTANIRIKFSDTNGGYINASDTLEVSLVHYTICGTNYSLRTTGAVNFSLSGDTVKINYNDCILPLNGTSGGVELIFVQ